MTDQTVAYLRALSGLPSGTTMHYRVRTKNLDGTQFTSADKTFTTLAATGYHAPAPTSQFTVNVRDKGAVGNGVTDDTAAIQAAIDQVGGTGGTVYVPDGTYRIKCRTSGDTRIALNLKSNMTFRMSAGATLKLDANALYIYFMLLITGLTNVNVIGGKLQGERHQHLTAGNDAWTTERDSFCPSNAHCWGEWGMGVAIYNSTNIYIEGVHLREMWGDGVYVNRGSNINVYNIVADDNRRQGVSIVVVNGATVRDSVLKNTYGHLPSDGIDVEPSSAGEVAENILIENNHCIGNRGNGIHLTVPNVLGTSAQIRNVTIRNNLIENNGWVTGWTGGIFVEGYGTHHNIITNNVINGSIGRAAIVTSYAYSNTVSNNTGTGNNGVNGDLWDTGPSNVYTNNNVT
jgi:hypothetical protein